jgi:hypothetical protein
MRSRQKHGVLNGMTVDFAIDSVYVRGVPVVRGGRLSARVQGRMVRPARVGVTAG